MLNAAFNFDDPWQSWANFLFDFDCAGCSARVEFHWPEQQTLPAWRQACVETAEDAQRQGWTCVAERTFLCPQCSTLQIGSYPHNLQ